jgi:hypothetical protein
MHGIILNPLTLAAVLPVVTMILSAIFYFNRHYETPPKFFMDNAFLINGIAFIISALTFWYVGFERWFSVIELTFAFIIFISVIVMKRLDKKTNV